MRILIVEDEKQTVEIYRESLSDEGYAVDSAYSGEEGESLAENIPYDLILLDVMLPGKNGFEVCRDLRCKKNETPIMMISGKMKDDPDVIRGLDCGADEYLLKPVRLEMLSAKIRALLRKRQNIRNTQMRIGDCVINTAYRQVWRGKKEVVLTKKEYGILEFLAYHLNMIVSRTELEQHVWDLNQDIGSNVVDEHIKNLRKKLGDGIVIETIKGMGYRLKV